MYRLKNKLKQYKKHHIALPIVAIAGVALALSGGSTPLFENTNDFVLFATGEVTLEQETQVSSGDIGSNDELKVGKEAIISGNLFGDETKLEKVTIINGNATYNELKLKDNSQILGEQTSPTQFPIANILDIPSFKSGTQSFTFEGDSNTLTEGNFKDITLEKDAQLTLTGGTYNLKKLKLKKNSTLIFSTTTVINIKDELKGGDTIAILPGANTLFDGLQINLKGKKGKKDDDDNDNDNDDNGNDKDKKSKKGKDDDDNGDDEDNNNDKNKKDDKDTTVKFGKNSFLNFKLLAPKAKVTLGKNTTFRGQILAREIKVGKGGVLSLVATASLIPKQEDIVVTEEGAAFVVNHIILQLTPDGTMRDANTIVKSVNGSIVGTVPSINLYQILVQTSTTEELDALIQQLLSSSNPIIKNVTKNTITSLIQ